MQKKDTVTFRINIRKELYPFHYYQKTIIISLLSKQERENRNPKTIN